MCDRYKIDIYIVNLMLVSVPGNIEQYWYNIQNNYLYVNDNITHIFPMIIHFCNLLLSCINIKYSTLISNQYSVVSRCQSFSRHQPSRCHLHMSAIHLCCQKLASNHTTCINVGPIQNRYLYSKFDVCFGPSKYWIVLI